MLGVLAFFSIIAGSFAQDLNFNDLKNYLVSKKVSSIEQALPDLVQKYPDYFTFNTLMYGSLSAQESSFAEPRVIVFGSDAKFVMAFTGHEQMRGGKSFETMSFEGNEFKFRTIIFKYPGWDQEELGVTPGEIDFESEQLIVSKANPALCLRCHGQNAGPIWAPYFLWQGAYGSDDDHLHMSFDRASWNPNNQKFFEASTKPQSQGRLMVFKSGHADTELDAMVNYVKARPQHPRYKWLPEGFVEEGIKRHDAGTPFEQLDYTNKAAQERQRLNANYAWPSRPNLYFQMALMDRNQERIIAKLQGLKDKFTSPFWENLGKIPLDAKSPSLWGDLAAELERGLNLFTFKGARPTAAEIETMVKKNIIADLDDQRGRMRVHDNLLGRGSIEFFYYPGQQPIRHGLDWVDAPIEFFKNLLGLGSFSETDKVAIHMETGDMIYLTMLQILLRDQGIELGEYNMNLGRRSPSFHSGGLDAVTAYLGIPFFR